SFGSPAKVAILIGAPLVALAGTEIAARRERTRYVAGLLAILSIACFVNDLSLLGATFNVTPGHAALLAWAAFSLILACTSGLRLPLAAGIVSLIAYVSASPATWEGTRWLDLGRRPENLLLPGAACFAIGALAARSARDGFPAVYRIVGALVVLVGVF